MKPMANDLGMCGIEQMFYAGTVAFDDKDVDKGIAIFTAPNKLMITRAVAVVTEAFDAGTTNVVVVGTEDDDDAILAAADITEGTEGTYSKQTFVELAKGDKVCAKYTQTGTDATAGAADIYLFAVGVAE